MFKKRIFAGAQVSVLALGLAGVVTVAAPSASADTIDQAAAQLAARGDSFAASSAELDVLPLKMAGSCPRSFMLKVDLGAAAPGTLSYQIETLDGRVSQVFEAKTRALADGGFGVHAAHEIALREDLEAEAGVARVAFTAPARTLAEPAPEPGFFERIFGTAGTGDLSQGLGQQSFRVKVVAPNEIVSTFDRPSVSCEYNEILRKVAEDQHEGDRDRPGRDKSRDTGRDRPGRDTGRGGSGGAAGTID